MLALTHTLINGVSVSCINQAAVRFHVPATLLLAVVKTENGKPGWVRQNRNHTFDVGVMQINSQWFTTLSHLGYSKATLIYNGCANVMAGAWILSKSIAKANQLWRGVGDYHSHTDAFNAEYQHRVNVWYSRIKTALTR